MKKIIIALDGFSSCGKSTMAKRLARAIGYIYVDSGAMYRAVTLYALQHGLFDTDGHLCVSRLQQAMPEIQVGFQRGTDGSVQTLLNGTPVEQEIRTLRVSQHVSEVAAQPFVREAMTRQLQAMGQARGIVMDGRDIGTTVFPQAELKVFVTASAEVRAQRRFLEMQAKGQTADFDEILKNVRERDHIDSTRSVSPLRQADDAIVLDNSNMTLDEQHQWLLTQFRRICPDAEVHEA